jgi:hypothetical protein
MQQAPEKGSDRPRKAPGVIGAEQPAAWEIPEPAKCLARILQQNSWSARLQLTAVIALRQGI